MTKRLNLENVRNPFRSKFMREVFADMVHAYNAKSPLLFLPGGAPHRGNSWAGMFWRGFDSAQVGIWDCASKSTGAYPCWLAGKAVRAALAKVQP
jgi:hypothetical protein